MRSCGPRSTCAAPTEAQRSDQLQAQLLQVLCAAGRPDLRDLLFTRWGHTLLTFMTDLPPEAAPLLQQYSDLRLPAAVIELPVGVDGYLVTAQPPGPVDQLPRSCDGKCYGSAAQIPAGLV